jgi:Polyketide cyclase / dehydrase and lipid transport
MAHVEGEIIINRPVEEVFDFVADERNEPRYNEEMLKCELTTGESIGAGSRFHAEMSMRGKPVGMTVEFIGYDRPRVLASVSQVSSMDIEGQLVFDPIPEGTRMHWSWNLKPHGFLRLLTPLVTRMGRQQERRIWGSLTHYLEERPALVPQE